MQNVHVALSQYTNVFLQFTAAQRCANGTLHLVGGPVESAGRVEICIHGVWGRVCGGTYGNYSKVVCRHLGYNVDAEESELKPCIGQEDW